MKRKRKSKSTRQRLDRCVAAVRRKGGARSPYAVCRASEKGRGRGSRRRPAARRDPMRQVERFVILAVNASRIPRKSAKLAQLEREGRVGYWNGRKWVSDRNKGTAYASQDLALEDARIVSKRWKGRAVFGVAAVKRPMRNPVSGGADQVAQGERLYERFSGHRVDRRAKVRVRLPKAAVVFGQLVGVIYKARRNGRVGLYQHNFKPGAAPGLATAADGSGLFAVGGKFKVTDRGITDE